MFDIIDAIKEMVLPFFERTVVGDDKVYRIKGTPIKFKRPLTKAFLEKYGSLPVDGNKIVIDNYMGHGYGCNGKFVTEELLKQNKGYDIVWTVKNVEKNKKYFPKGVRLVEYLSDEAMYEYATSKVWLSNYHMIAYYRLGLVKKTEQKYIQMWHGSFGIKKIERDTGVMLDNKMWCYFAQKSSENTDYWVSNSKFESDVYNSAFWGVKNIVLLGHPRNDVFFLKDTKEIYGKVEQELKLKPEQKIMLYVPTYTEEMMSEDKTLNFKTLKESLDSKTGENWSIVVRLHPRVLEKSRIALFKKWPFLIDATDYQDIQELLARADACLTNYSSCIFDFMLSEKPAFIFAPDMEKYNTTRGFYYKLEETPFPIAKTNEELKSNILNFDSELYKKNLKQFLQDKGSIEDGKASIKVAKLVDDIFQGKA